MTRLMDDNVRRAQSSESEGGESRGRGRRAAGGSDCDSCILLFILPRRLGRGLKDGGMKEEVEMFYVLLCSPLTLDVGVRFLIHLGPSTLNWNMPTLINEKILQIDRLCAFC